MRGWVLTPSHYEPFLGPEAECAEYAHGIQPSKNVGCNPAAAVPHTPFSSSDTDRPKLPASISKALRPASRLPFSSSEMWLRPNPETSARYAWVHPCLLRS